jgi:UDP-N-acetylmuramate--alanine ligase
MVDLDTPKRIHIIGVAGAGMSALAKLLAQLGHDVSGSDLKAGPTLDLLESAGVRTWTGSRPAALADTELVVASSAVPDHDPEYVAAGEKGIAVWRRPRLLEALTGSMPAIGATGTHGKTTTTAMMIAMLRSIGADPSFVVGGQLVDLRTNAHLGRSHPFVIEADEAFRTFESLHLRGLVVTNVEPEHLSHFGSVFEMEDAFVEVVRRVDGPVVVGIDDAGGRRLADRTGRPTYGTAAESAWRITGVEEKAMSVSFRLSGPGFDETVAVARPGLHTARNAAGAIALTSELGFDAREAARALSEFAGIRRRYEVRATIGGVTIIDDYAHHPTEVAATVRTALKGGWGRVLAVFQPHLYSRTETFQREFGLAMSGCDHIVVTDVFGAREVPRPGVTGALVADAARTLTDAEVHYVAHRVDLAGFLVGLVGPGDLVLTMGAGDITLLPDELAELLSQGNG